MPTRRVILGATGAGIAAAGAGAFWGNAWRAQAEYERAVGATWRHADGLPDDVADPVREAVRYATLAASSHNTQCWRFAAGSSASWVLPDFTRRLPVVDADNHHLFASIGCAVENLLVAASALGLRGEAHYVGERAGVRIDLEARRPAPSALFDAIPRRQSTRGEYDGKALPAGELRLLESAGTARGVSVRLFTARAEMEAILDFVLAGNTAQMSDPAFVAELKKWVRFNGAQAARSGDGLFAGASGNPSLPGWLGSRMFDLVFDAKAENEKAARHVRSSAGVAVFVCERDDPQHWIQAGRAFQRFALQATALGIRTAHLNQPVEVADLRPAFARVLGIGPGRPDLVVRFGRGPEMPRSLRRPLAAVMA